MSKISEDYEQYLFMLQERNKLLKKLRQKDLHQVDLEKREQGFSLYLNGANLNKSKRVPPTRKGRPKTRQRTSKTAGDSEVKDVDTAIEAPAEDRARTAPSKRKSWTCNSLELKTEDGQAVHVPVPGLISGYYNDDFEPPSDSSELNVSFEDIGTLRKSLEKDSAIFTSLKHSTEHSRVDGEYLSSDSSCSEELESQDDDYSPHTSPSIQQEESGIVIEFDSQHPRAVSLVSHPITVKSTSEHITLTKRVNRTEPPLPVPSTLSKELATTGGEGITEFCSSGITGPTLATRSLSAVRRKHVLPQIDGTELSQDVIDAVSAENDQTASQYHSRQPKDDSDHESEQSEQSVDEIDNGSKVIEPPINTGDTSTIKQATSTSFEPGSAAAAGEDDISSVVNSQPVLPVLPDKPFSQIKPVLVNRYKLKLSSGTPKASELQPVDSLTEQTLSIITAKVRNMDASKQKRLLDLLSRLDTPVPPSSLPTPPHPPTPRDQASTPVWLESTPAMCGDHVTSPPRPSSTRSTSLQSTLASQPTNSQSRPPSGRVSALRGVLGSGGSRNLSDGHVSDSRGELRSGRVSSLRDELKSGCGPHSSHSETFLPHLEEFERDIRSSSSNPCLTSETTTGDNPSDRTLIGSVLDVLSPTITPLPPREPRLNTAVLAKGRCRLPLVSESHLVDGVGSLDVPTVVPAVSSTGEPDVRSSQTESWDRRSECLESISKFDHTHLGQLNTNMQDDILESFLSEYREKRERHSVSTPPSDDEEFATPKLPRGRELVLHIFSTWGDKFYVGLTGVEVYTETGELAEIRQITALPSDINDLPEYNNDPRVVSNLLDGVNQTRDDLHMWLAPFTPSHDHTVTIQFTRPTTLALVRIWNYNKSRIHSARGARLVEMTLDHQTIFRGEIARGEHGETILFTTDEDILYLVSQHDSFYQSQIFDSGQLLSSDPVDPYRPSTGDSCSYTHRPFTAAEHKTLEVEESLDTSQNPSGNEGANEGALLNQECRSGSKNIGQVLQLVLSETWGDLSSVGLTGLAMLTSGGEVLQLTNEQIFSEVEGQTTSDSEVERLLDGANMTCDAEHMWAVPFDSSQPPTLTLSLDTPTHIVGIVVWNYNQSVEDSYRGVKVMHVYLDGLPLTPESGWLVRRAPGHVEYEYGQSLSFTDSPTLSTPPVECTLYPRGFVFQLQLLNSWGDPYYIGLNELELYDAFSHVIPLTLDNIAAYPDSVNVLPGVKGDLRTPDKLIDGVRGVNEPQHMWLTPILPGVLNSVYVIFNEPQTVSEVRLWNYGKTPNRGVKDIAVLVDNLLVYSGTIPRVLSHARGILPTLQPPFDPFIVPLGEGEVLDDEATGSSQSDIQLTNNKEVITHSRKPPPHVANQDLRPMTSLTGYSQRHRHKHW